MQTQTPTILEDRLLPGPRNARVVPGYIHVWAIIGELESSGWDIAAVAEGYGIPEEAVRAAIAYYRQHQAEIDARLADNRRD